MTPRNIHILLESKEIDASEIFKNYSEPSQLTIHKNIDSLITCIDNCENPNNIIIITDIQNSEILSTSLNADSKHLTAVITDTFKAPVQLLFDLSKLNYLIGMDIIKDSKSLNIILELLSGKKSKLSLSEIMPGEILERMSFVLHSTNEKEGIIATIEFMINNIYEKYVGGLAKQYATSFAITTDELLLNAVFDANPRLSNQPRNVDYILEEHEWVTIEVALGKEAIGISIKDKFGLLKKQDISTHLNHNDMTKQIAQKKSAGLGIRLAMNSSSQIIFNVIEGEYTEVISTILLQKSLQKFKKAPKSIIFSDVK